MYYTQERSGLIRDSGLGLFHICYGSGVGKTTRAVGLAIRAAGAGLRVDFVQFMKSGKSSEVALFDFIANIYYWCPGEHPFILSRAPDGVHYEHAERAFECALNAINSGTNLLICDELLDTILFGLIKEKLVVEMIKKCRKRTELILTGRDASSKMLELADYVTEFVQVKHPYYSGARARKGIEY